MFLGEMGLGNRRGKVVLLGCWCHGCVALVVVRIKFRFLKMRVLFGVFLAGINEGVYWV